MTMAQLQRPGIAGELPAVMPPAQIIPLKALASQLLYSGACIVTGFSWQNAGGSTDRVTLLDGTDSSGVTLAVSRMATLITDTEKLGDSGVLCQNGLYAIEQAGTTAGAVYVIPL